MNKYYQQYQKQIRLGISIAIGLISAGLTYWARTSIDGIWTDIPWAFNAARDLLAHQDPYRYQFDPGTVPYPLTAAILVIPFALLPSPLGIVILLGVAFGLIAFGLSAEGRYWRLLLLASPAYLTAVYTSQWSPIFIAALFFPALFPVILAKPSLMLPLLLGQRVRWQAGLAATVLLLLSLQIMPNWPWRWFAQTQTYDGFIPLLSPLGPFLALSLIGVWHNPAARMLFLMSLTPQHRFFYDQLFLWLIPQTPRQMLALCFPAWIAFFYVRLVYGNFWEAKPAILIGVYLPAILIVLWQERLQITNWLVRLGVPISFPQKPDHR